MRRVTRAQTASATGATAPVVMDINQSPFNVGIGVVISATGTYTVEHTFDDIYDSTVTPTWFPNTGLTSQTANKDGNYAFPVAAVRLNVAANTGSITMTLIQATDTTG